MRLRYRIFSFVCLVLVLGLYLATDAAAKRRSRIAGIEMRMRMHLRSIIGTQVEPGQKLPTNWDEFPKPAAWQHIHALAERHGLPAPTNLYAILRNPVVDPYYPDQKIWLIRAYPENRYTPPLRWGLAISNNVIVPVQIAEGDVGAEVLTQTGGHRR